MTPIALSAEPRRILLIKPSALGDVVQTLPILSLLRRRFPQAHIAWLLTPPSDQLLAGHPHLDEVIPFDRRYYGGSWKNPAALWRLHQFHRRLGRSGFDLAIDLQGLFRSGWLAWRSGARVRVGFDNAREWAGGFYTHRVPVQTMEQHSILRYLDVADALGCGREPVEFCLPISDAARARVEELVPGPQPYALIFPGTHWPTKRWPAGKFAELVVRIKESLGLRTVLGGSGADAEIGKEIPADLDLRGRTDIATLAALVQRAAVVITNDSGPMHLAAALGRPLVALFGPTNPVRTGPWKRQESVVRLEIACSPCYSRRCSHCSCLEWLEVGDVMRAVDRELARGRAVMESR